MHFALSPSIPAEPTATRDSCREPIATLAVNRFMNHLEDRVRELESRAARATRLITTLSLLLVGAICVAATTERSGDQALRSQRIEIIDRDGNTMAVLGSDEAGGFLSIRKTTGPAVMILGADRHGGFVTVRNRTGVPVSILAADSEGGFVTVRNHDGIPVLIGQTTANGGMLQVRDQVGNPVAVIQAEAKATDCRVRDHGDR